MNLIRTLVIIWSLVALSPAFNSCFGAGRVSQACLSQTDALLWTETRRTLCDSAGIP